MHQPLLGELSNEVDVDRAPGAGGLARSEANHVAGFVDTLSNPVDPAKAQCNLHGFGPGDAGLSGVFFVKADELLAELVMMSFEPGSEVGRSREECWFWRHSVVVATACQKKTQLQLGIRPRKRYSPRVPSSTFGPGFHDSAKLQPRTSRG